MNPIPNMLPIGVKVGLTSGDRFEANALVELESGFTASTRCSDLDSS
jgi:hypothetical protein